MNDIATASDKGRRTIYTYFKNKREIYNAVIERESEQLVARLKDVVNSTLPPLEKMRRYLLTRFEIISDIVVTRENGSSFRTFFSRDFRRVDRIRRLAVSKERVLFASVINEGITSDDFDPDQAHRVESFVITIFQGVDYSHIRDNFDEIGVDRDKLSNDVTDFVIDAITRKQL